MKILKLPIYKSYNEDSVDKIELYYIPDNKKPKDEEYVECGKNLHKFLFSQTPGTIYDTLFYEMFDHMFPDDKKRDMSKNFILNMFKKTFIDPKNKT